MELSKYYLNTNRLSRLDPWERDVWINLYYRLLEKHENIHDKMHDMYNKASMNMNMNDEKRLLFYQSLIHLFENLIQNEILITEREINIEKILEDDEEDNK